MRFITRTVNRFRQIVPPRQPLHGLAVIPAAGLGTRFLAAAKAQPKEMLALVDKPAIQYVVEEAVRSGITDILIITGRGKRSLEDPFDRPSNSSTTWRRRANSIS
jgi:UTP--glucose-1-phosphate uridylyltransferase